MRKIVWKLSVAVALLLGMTVCGASQASAQTSRFNVFGGYSYGTNNFFSGYYEGLPGGSTLNGYSVAFAMNFNNHVGLEANFSGHNGSSTILSEPSTPTSYGEQISTTGEGVYTYAFGPKLFQTVGDFSLFTHFLVGGVHLSQTLTETCTVPGNGGNCGTPNPEIYNQKGTGLAFMTGGGMDWNHGRWGIRILEVDYIHGQMVSSFTGSPSNLASLSASANNFQLATGVTFNFGSSL
jgi:hypothetical protein